LQLFLIGAPGGFGGGQMVIGGAWKRFAGGLNYFTGRLTGLGGYRINLGDAREV